ncbi:hypothetical protein GCM10010515_26530 [Streptomyces fructofermentans]|uniref:Uncharacterized protein n=1 Tax=Streptomyces fructofermentans TaxID=152141 RepID=A0A918NB65_9ACTN|nr:hypothetical protein GCM10010515_26530 [Streptomyces fructofermentans]
MADPAPGSTAPSGAAPTLSWRPLPSAPVPSRPLPSPAVRSCPLRAPAVGGRTHLTGRRTPSVRTGPVGSYMSRASPRPATQRAQITNPDAAIITTDQTG